MIVIRDFKGDGDNKGKYRWKILKILKKFSLDQ